MSDSLRPQGLQPTRLLHPWDFPGKSTGVGCHCLLRLEGNGRHQIRGYFNSSLQSSGYEAQKMELMVPSAQGTLHVVRSEVNNIHSRSGPRWAQSVGSSSPASATIAFCQSQHSGNSHGAAISSNPLHVCTLFADPYVPCHIISLDLVL